ncbi:MAG: hypothetical protein JWR72_786 [Flavisolibacter sp.]|nr:hypothetical protein [Flavisolibacter sp.]
MRKLLFGLAVLLSFVAKAQVYNNEWIDFTKTYYKFKVGKDGLYRISGADLATAGLSVAAAQHFQLWRNGVQVPIYTSLSSGTLTASDYIEFWGKMNDGKPDKELYREPGFQLNDKWSLISDSAAYFLTVNPAGPNLRLQPTSNNVAGNTLPAEPYFIHTASASLKDKINSGLYYIVGADHLFSSSYDKGEGWSSGDIERNATYTANFTGLFAAASGPAPKIRTSVFGNSYNSRRYRVTINGDSVSGADFPYLNQAENEASFNLSLLNSGTAAAGVTNVTETCDTAGCPVDKMVLSKLEISYPRQFNFGGASNFEFSLPASVTGNYLEISGFTNGGVDPVLYDLTNGKRYVGEISGSLVKVAIEASTLSRNLVLVSQVTGGITPVSSLQPRTFTDYKLTVNQADYLIVSNPLLFNGAGGTNPVEDYRSYRASAQGGSYNAKIFLDEQLVDQFGFGIKKNPAGIRNFIRFARNTFLATPRQVFLIGRGVHYLHQLSIGDRGTQTQKENLEKLNLVPTYGWPSSDLLLSAEPGTSSPGTPIGRLTAITPAEVSLYLKKVKDLERAQQTLSPEIGDKAWMKNIAHIAGAGDEPLASILGNALNSYKRIIEDSLYGAKVYTFEKTSTSSVQQLSDADLTNLFNQGLSLVTYYGHSSPTTLEFNLDEPANYNNQGKYPMFFALGCNAGNTFDYNESRFTTRNYLSDKYVLAPERGSINFIASSHFGIVHYLDIWNSRAYNNMARSLYKRSIGEIIKKTIDDVYSFLGDDFFARCNAEETILNGDPAVTFNQQAKPDYAIMDTMVKIAPNFISVADQSFKVNISVFNLGKAINRPSVVETKRQYPDGSITVLRRDTLNGTRYRDELVFNIPIDPIKDKGANKLFVTVDADNVVDELFETNNSTSRDFFIFEDEARPVYPYNFAIVNNRNITLKASTANPFDVSKQYKMEIDTTELFNSPSKLTNTITSVGGLLEFAPGLSFADSTVYYWRVAPVPASGSPIWNTSSFVYLSNSTSGFNQSHLYQHQKSAITDMDLAPGNNWNFHEAQNNLLIRSGVFPTATSQAAELAIAVNGVNYIRSVCGLPNIIVNVFDPNTFKPWFNNNGGLAGQYGSDPVCGQDRAYNFQFTLTDSSKRRKLVQFLEMIPSQHIVVIRNTSGTDPNNNYFVNGWKSDTTYFGSNRSIYHHLYSQGFVDADSFTRPRAFIFTYKKNAQAQVPSKSIFSEGIFDKITLSADYATPDTIGSVTSPIFGPAMAWKEFKWSGTSADPGLGDRPTVNIIGVKPDGRVDTLIRNINASQQIVDVSSINASTYRFLQLHMINRDSVYHTPFQFKYWRLTYDPAPEGAVLPNVLFIMKDTLEVGEPLEGKIAFKNISDAPFSDSIRIKVTVFDRTNTPRIFEAPKQKKPLNSGEVINVPFTIDTKQLAGANNLFVDINPDNDQPEQYHFNNFIFRNFFVRGDTLNPLMDVTFDNVHILNRDIVSSKPNILIKLKDEAKWMLLNDSSLTTVQVRYPDNSGGLGSGSVTRTFNFNSDTLKFIPATGAPNADNMASIQFAPYFEKDGDYELIITGKDRSNNTAGTMSYRVGFQVINKPMISNMLNYPNPFTTSTAFVFTLTGSAVPQNIKIQILTVTGKIVREITKGELGPLHIGNNITEFKWDGTDQYGQKVGNGVYLYRVVTNLDGKSLDKYKGSEDNTDKYFNKGYGKMYLMR